MADGTALADMRTALSAMATAVHAMETTLGELMAQREDEGAIPDEVYEAAQREGALGVEDRDDDEWTADDERDHRETEAYHRSIANGGAL